LPQECMLSRNAKCPWTSRIMRMMAHSHQSWYYYCPYYVSRW
jgi:hypothetical protein